MTMPEINHNLKIERLLDVEMNVTVRFGRSELPLRELVRFGVGSMIELNRSVDEPVELLVNNYPFARGEVVVIDGYYGVRVTEIGSPEERSRTILSHTEEDADDEEVTE
jgi:flagellar motor switch protein FliN